jgi:hypothetical protein
MTARYLVTFGVALLFTTSCGSNSSPAPPSPTTTSVTVNSTSSQVLLGASEAFGAVATLSNGTTVQVTTGSWSTDAPSVAQVDGSGRVTGAASGTATISVIYQGTRGSKQIRVLPNYQGNWLGSYVVGSCSETQEFQNPDFCGTVFPTGRVFPLVFIFTQSGTALSGTAILGQLASSNSTAPIQNDGSVLLPAIATLSPSTFTETWSLNQTQVGKISGTLHVLITNTTLLGSATMDASLINTNIASSSATASTGHLHNLTRPQSLDALAEMLRVPWN